MLIKIEEYENHFCISLEPENKEDVATLNRIHLKSKKGATLTTYFNERKIVSSYIHIPINNKKYAVLKSNL